MLQAGRNDVIARFYRLFSRVNGGLPPIAACLKAHLKADGAALVSYEDSKPLAHHTAVSQSDAATRSSANQEQPRDDSSRTTAAAQVAALIRHYLLSMRVGAATVVQRESGFSVPPAHLQVAEF